MEITTFIETLKQLNVGFYIGVPAMQKITQNILTNHRAQEADDMCMSISKILTLIPEEF